MHCPDAIWHTLLNRPLSVHCWLRWRLCCCWSLHCFHSTRLRILAMPPSRSSDPAMSNPFVGLTEINLHVICRSNGGNNWSSSSTYLYWELGHINGSDTLESWQPLKPFASLLLDSNDESILYCISKFTGCEEWSREERCLVNSILALCWLAGWLTLAGMKCSQSFETN